MTRSRFSARRHARRGHRRPARGFTLLELVISVALVLVLMLAITKIFSITSSTIGATQGIAAATRDARAAQTVFARDLGAMASDSPFIWIRSDEPFGAFRNADDEKNDEDGDPTTIDIDGADSNGNGKLEGDTNVKGENVSALVITPRRHRLDRFAFFARDRFVRQTGNTAGNVMVSGLTSSEALIYYGPTVIANSDGRFQLKDSSGLANPGDGTAGLNANNYYASQWILGRFAPVMILPPAYPGSQVLNENGVLQEFYPHVTVGTSKPELLSPFSSTTNSINASNNVPVSSARYDLFGVDMATATSLLQTYVADPANNPNTTAANDWRRVIFNSRLRLNPYLTKPINSNSAAQQVPAFVNACSQFIVEFAGDFVEQDQNANIVDVDGDGNFLEPDGKIDFVLVNGVRQIKWYGYPRDMNGDGVVDANVTSPDVSTVTDFAYPDNTAWTTATYTYNVIESYITGGKTGAKNTHKIYNSRPNAYETYLAGWDTSSLNNPAIPRPKMYRITIAIDRPEMAGRSADPQTFEYVFNVP